MIQEIIAYIGLFISSFLSSSFLPMTSDGVVIYMVLKGYYVPQIILVSSLGSYFGFCSIYLAGYFGRNVFLDKVVKINKGKMEKAEKIFKKYGFWILFFAWLPIIGEAFVALAGILRVSFPVFSALTFLGAVFRFTMIALIFTYLT